MNGGLGRGWVVEVGRGRARMLSSAGQRILAGPEAGAKWTGVSQLELPRGRSTKR